MNNDLFLMHALVQKNISLDKKRFLYDKINWDARAICIAGARGTGKTTLMLQYALEAYNDPSRCLYISGDYIQVISLGLFEIAKNFFAYGGECLIVDEVHKYPNWSQEIKNIYDVYTDKKIFISGSSTLDLTKARFDLSRRFVYHHLPPLSFREYLYFTDSVDIHPFTLEEIINNHTSLAIDLLNKGSMLKQFADYVRYGCYPYFFENRSDYNSKLMGAVEKVLFEDITIVYNIAHPKIPVLKKILWMIATSSPFIPNINGMARDLGVSRPAVYNYLDILENAALLRFVRESVKGAKIARKTGKLFFENSNILHAVAGNIQGEAEQGTLRETFFASQLSQTHKISLHQKADFIVDDTFVFEVGGSSKKEKQIVGLENAYLAIDGVEIGKNRKIPLYLFGFLY